MICSRCRRARAVRIVDAAGAVEVGEVPLIERLLLRRHVERLVRRVEIGLRSAGAIGELLLSIGVEPFARELLRRWRCFRRSLALKLAGVWHRRLLLVEVSSRRRLAFTLLGLPILRQLG